MEIPVFLRGLRIWAVDGLFTASAARGRCRRVDGDRAAAATGIATRRRSATPGIACAGRPETDRRARPDAESIAPPGRALYGRSSDDDAARQPAVGADRHFEYRIARRSHPRAICGKFIVPSRSTLRRQASRYGAIFDSTRVRNDFVLYRHCRPRKRSFVVRRIRRDRAGRRRRQRQRDFGRTARDGFRHSRQSLRCDPKRALTNSVER